MHLYRPLEKYLDRNRSITVAVILGTILFTGFLLRIWNISFGLPYLYHPDEPMVAIVAVRMYKNVSLNPHFFHYPSLFFYINMFAYFPMMYVGKLLGYFESLNDIYPPFMLIMGSGKTDTPSVMLLGKWFSILLGTAVIFFIYKIGRMLTGSVSAGLIAAAVVALSPTNIEYCHYMTTDTILVFFIVLSVYYSQKILKYGHTRYYILSGLFAGLAASSKYNGAVVVCGILAAHCFRTGFAGWKDLKIYAAVIVSVAAFLVTTPYALLTFDKFYEGLRYDVTHYASGHEGMEKNVLRWYATHLIVNEGIIIIFSFFGLLLAFIKRNKQVLIIYGFTLVYLVFVSMFTVRNARTILPVIPMLILTGAWCVTVIYNYFRKRKNRLLICLCLVLSAGSIYLPAMTSFRFVHRLGIIDSRETARVWIEENIPLKSKIALEGYSPYIDKNKYILKGLDRIIDHPPAYYMNKKFDYLVFSEGMYGRYFKEPDQYHLNIKRYNLFFDVFDHVITFNDGDYEVKIYKNPGVLQ
ncbi:MAG: glycosyltransferase family 39 protein [Candidatus Auribacterota bacterium]|jgi:4-amino-4-deoxy-L-arabinose transferase-like glycosyltransferase|nr:glycosyltransferase family 39 protein [Candidatus Auribacterota bacterium]